MLAAPRTTETEGEGAPKDDARERAELGRRETASASDSLTTDIWEAPAGSTTLDRQTSCIGSSRTKPKNTAELRTLIARFLFTSFALPPLDVRLTRTQVKERTERKGLKNSALFSPTLQ